MIKINKAGYIYILLTILIGFSAVNTGNNLVYIVTSALLSYMLVSGVFGRKNIYGVDVLLEFPEELYAETDIPVAIKITNHNRFSPVFLIRVSFGGQAVFLPFLNVKSAARQHLNLRFESRGVHSVGDIRISSVFPFNLFTRYRSLPCNSTFTVFPKPRKCSFTDLNDHRSRSKGDTSSERVGYDSDLLSIRDYVPGDPRKYISWKSTAKTGHLKTKELSAIEFQHFMIDFDRLEKKNLEHALSCTTYLILKCMKSKTPVGLCIDGEAFKPGISSTHKTRLLKKLALYGQN